MLTDEYIKNLEIAVERGVKLLDEKWPTWRKKLRKSLAKETSLGLQMAYCKRCVLGNLMGSYDEGLIALFPRLSFDGRENKAKEYGFTCENTTHNSANYEGFIKLEELWLKKIEVKEDAEA